MSGSPVVGTTPYGQASPRSMPKLLKEQEDHVVSLFAFLRTHRCPKLEENLSRSMLLPYVPASALDSDANGCSLSVSASTSSIPPSVAAVSRVGASTAALSKSEGDVHVDARGGDGSGGAAADPDAGPSAGATASITKDDGSFKRTKRGRRGARKRRAAADNAKPGFAVVALPMEEFISRCSVLLQLVIEVKQQESLTISQLFHVHFCKQGAPTTMHERVRMTSLLLCYSNCVGNDLTREPFVNELLAYLRAKPWDPDSTLLGLRPCEDVLNETLKLSTQSMIDSYDSSNLVTMVMAWASLPEGDGLKIHRLVHECAREIKSTSLNTMPLVPGSIVLGRCDGNHALRFARVLSGHAGSFSLVFAPASDVAVLVSALDVFPLSDAVNNVLRSGDVELLGSLVEDATKGIVEKVKREVRGVIYKCLEEHDTDCSLLQRAMNPESLCIGDHFPLTAVRRRLRTFAHKPPSDLRQRVVDVFQRGVERLRACESFLPFKLRAINSLCEHSRSSDAYIEKRLTEFEAGGREGTQHIRSLVDDLLLGRTKKEVTRWWQHEVRTNAAALLQAVGYDSDAVGTHDYISNPPKDLVAVRRNVELLQQLLQGMHGDEEAVTELGGNEAVADAAARKRLSHLRAATEALLAKGMPEEQWLAHKRSAYAKQVVSAGDDADVSVRSCMRVTAETCYGRIQRFYDDACWALMILFKLAPSHDVDAGLWELAERDVNDGGSGGETDGEADPRDGREVPAAKALPVHAGSRAGPGSGGHPLPRGALLPVPAKAGGGRDRGGSRDRGRLRPPVPRPVPRSHRSGNDAAKAGAAAAAGPRRRPLPVPPGSPASQQHAVPVRPVSPRVVVGLPSPPRLRNGDGKHGTALPAASPTSPVEAKADDDAHPKPRSLASLQDVVKRSGDSFDGLTRCIQNLVDDMDYLREMVLLEIRPERKSQHIIPISGLVVSQLVRREKELKTVLEVWDPTYSSSQKGAQDDMTPAPTSSDGVDLEAAQSGMEDALNEEVSRHMFINDLEAKRQTVMASVARCWVAVMEWKRGFDASDVTTRSENARVLCEQWFSEPLAGQDASPELGDADEGPVPVNVFDSWLEHTRESLTMAWLRYNATAKQVGPVNDDGGHGESDGDGETGKPTRRRPPPLPPH